MSLCRDELKGVAILWVVVFHMELALPGALRTAQLMGYGGVDIFFFLTGFGLYRSLERSDDLRGYWARRMRRLAPSYLPLIALWLVVMLPGYGLSRTQAIRCALGNLLPIGFWLGAPKTFNWYVSGLLLFLVLAPYCAAALRGGQKPLRTLGALLMLSLLAGLGCIGQDSLMALSRLPVFLLGMWFGMDRPLVRRPWLGATGWALSFAVGLGGGLLCYARFPELLNDYGLYWYPFALIVPPLCAGLSWLMSKAGRAGRLLAPLRVAGRASFEIYLLNIWLVELLRKYEITSAASWALGSLGCVLAGVSYHALIEGLRGALARRRAATRDTIRQKEIEHGR